VPATVATRLERLETAQRAADRQRRNAGIRQLGQTMAPEHIRFVQDWMREHLGSPDAVIARQGESIYATLTRLRPPALVRASWLMIDDHVRNDTPVSLAPAVAEVYLVDPAAYPADRCDGCGYLLPLRGTVRPDGSFHHVVWYLGACPVCGLDNHPEEDASP
jgi:hypothetical protein